MRDEHTDLNQIVLARFRRATHEFLFFVMGAKVFVGAPAKPGQDEKEIIRGEG
jgi:hypothetical protein